MKPYVFHPEAAAEYAQAVQYYAAIAPEVAERFYAEIEGLIQQIWHQPDRFFRFWPPARRALGRKFPYSVVYLDQPSRVWIVAVAHAKRRPGYWQQRV